MPARSRLTDGEARDIARSLLRQKKIFPDVVGALVKRGRKAGDAALVVARSRAELRRESDIQIGWSSLGVGLLFTVGTFVLAPPGGVYIVAYGGIFFGISRLVRGYGAKPELAQPDAGFRAWAEEAASEVAAQSKSSAKRPTSKAATAASVAAEDDDEDDDDEIDEIEDSEIDVEIVEEPAGRQHPTSELRASVPGLGTLDVWVRKAGVLDRFASRLGARPIVVDRPFSEVYTVTSNDPDLARAWLSPEVQRAVLGVHSASFRVAGEQVVTKCHRALLETAALRELLAATRALAARPHRIAASIDRLAIALGSTAPAWEMNFDAWPSFAWDLAPATLTVRVVQAPPPTIRQRAPIFIQVTVDRTAKSSVPFVLVRKNAAEGISAHARVDGARASFAPNFTLHLSRGAELDADARRELTKLTTCPELAAVVRDDETVTVFLAGVVLDPELHREVGAALVKLASPPAAGPYR